MIIDSTDEIIGIDDVIAIKEILWHQFYIKRQVIIDEKNKKIGKAVGYTLAAGNFIIQQLRIRRPLLKSFGDTELLIHRSGARKRTKTRCA